MKCHAGIEFKSGDPCPKCGAKLGEVCWPGINADLAELPKLREALENIARLGSVDLSGEYEPGLRGIIRSMTDCAKTAVTRSQG